MEEKRFIISAALALLVLGRISVFGSTFSTAGGNGDCEGCFL